MADSELHLVNCWDIKPVRIGLALKSSDPAINYTCSCMGYLPMTQEDGLLHHQPFLVNKHASDTIMSPEAIMQSCLDFASYCWEGFNDNSPGVLAFYNSSRTLLLRLVLHKKNGLYYCPIATIATDTSSVRPQISQSYINSYMNQLEDDLGETNQVPPTFSFATSFHPCLPSMAEGTAFNPLLDPLTEQPFDHASPTISASDACPDSLENERPSQRSRLRRRPIQAAQQLESELWAARLGFCSEWQLDTIPGCAEGIPNQFDYHPFRFLDHKEQARIWKQAAARLAQKVSGAGDRFDADFGFLRASTEDFSQPNEDADRVVQSFGGYNSYLLIVDEHSRYVCIFLCKSKDPPIEEMSSFLQIGGRKEGGFMRCDQGGKLANCKEFFTTM